MDIHLRSPIFSSATLEIGVGFAWIEVMLFFVDTALLAETHPSFNEQYVQDSEQKKKKRAPAEVVHRTHFYGSILLRLSYTESGV